MVRVYYSICPTPKLEDHHLKTVCNSFFCMFTSALWWQAPSSTTWGHAMLWTDTWPPQKIVLITCILFYFFPCLTHAVSILVHFYMWWILNEMLFTGWLASSSGISGSPNFSGIGQMYFDHCILQKLIALIKCHKILSMDTDTMCLKYAVNRTPMKELLTSVSHSCF